MKWVYLLLGILLAACQCQRKPEQILFTTRLEGTLQPCGCTSEPLGGISRIARLRVKSPDALFFDAGNTWTDPKQSQTCPDPEKELLLKSIFKELEATLLPAGESVAYHSVFSGLQLVVSSLPKDELEKFSFQTKPDLILWSGSKEDGLLPPFRLNGSGPWVFSAGFQGQYLGRLTFLNLEEPGPIQLDTRAQERELRRDLIQKRLEGLRSQATSEFIKSRIQVAEQELQELGKVQDKPLQGKTMRFDAIAIKRDIKRYPPIEAQVEAYEKKMPQRLKACESQIDCPKLDLGQPRFVGVETCKQCHAPAVDFWEKAVVKVPGKSEKGFAIERLAGHSKAWKTLEDANKTLDRNCIGCHSVGFMKPGGYCKAQEVGQFKNVQCESCHGPGSLHASTGNKMKIKREVPESHCRSCHHVPHIPTESSFVYKEKLKVILGPGHGESLLLRLNK